MTQLYSSSSSPPNAFGGFTLTLSSIEINFFIFSINFLSHLPASMASSRDFLSSSDNSSHSPASLIILLSSSLSGASFEGNLNSSFKCNLYCMVAACYCLNPFFFSIGFNDFFKIFYFIFASLLLFHANTYSFTSFTPSSSRYCSAESASILAICFFAGQ